MVQILRATSIIVLALMATLGGAAPLEDGTEIPCQSNTIKQTRKKGNGNPHQNFIFKQISGTTDCTNNPNGAASISKGLTVGYSVSAGFAGDFITGGFDVSVSQSTGEVHSYGCKTNNGVHKGSLCVFQRIQATAFTGEVRHCTESTCAGTTCGNWGGAGVIFAPNNDQSAGCYYDNFQLNLPCREKGSEHYVKSGPKGGPHFIACQPTHAH